MELAKAFDNMELDPVTLDLRSQILIASLIQMTIIDNCLYVVYFVNQHFEDLCLPDALSEVTLKTFVETNYTIE